jgi:hypothetical protein
MRVPWAGPEASGWPYPTLGWTIGQWIEEHCVIPDGDHVGEPYLLTDEMWEFVLQHYRLRPNAVAGKWKSAWSYRRSMLVRPQKWGKGPLTAALVCAEAMGPVLFDGWDAQGEPVGRPWASPHIQVTATSEDQTANVYGVLLPMIQEGPLADMIPDTGETRINVPRAAGRGLIEPVTAAANSRLGQRITFAVQDETQLWVQSNGGLTLSKNQLRGLGGTGGRSVQTTNTWDPAEESAAQLDYESGSSAVYINYRQADKHLKYGVKADRKKIHKQVYGDSWWVDLDVIEEEAADLLLKDPTNAERFYGNRIVRGKGRWMPETTWDAAERFVDIPEDGAPICLGFDGSDTGDWSALIAITMDGTVFVPTYGPDFSPCVWNPEDFGGKVPRGEVMAARDELEHRFKVVRAYADPFGWRSEIAEWANKYQSVNAEWPTNQDKRMHEQLLQFETDIASKEVGYIGSRLLSTHVANARRVARPGQRYTLGKASQNQKIDAAMSMLLAHAARHDAIKAGWRPRSSMAIPAGGRMVVKRR